MTPEKGGEMFNAQHYMPGLQKASIKLGALLPLLWRGDKKEGNSSGTR